MSQEFVTRDWIPSEFNHNLIERGVEVVIRYDNKRAIGPLYKIRKTEQRNCHQYIDCGSCKVKWIDNEQPHKASLRLVILDGVECLLGQVAIRYIENSSQENQHLNNRSSNIFLASASVPSNVCRSQTTICYHEKHPL